VVLQRAEVEHLVAVAEVDGGEIALAALAVETRLAAQPRVVPAERDGRGPQRGVAADVRALQRDLPGVRPVLLYRDVPHVGTVAEHDLDNRVDEVPEGRVVAVMVGTVGPEPVEHRDFRGFTGDDERVRKAREPLALGPVEHDNRLVDDDTRGHLHHRAAGEKRVVQHGERVGRRVGADPESSSE
jgi:hypothetical protein